MRNHPIKRPNIAHSSKVMISHLFLKCVTCALKVTLNRHNNFPLQWIEYFPGGRCRWVRTAGAETHCVCLVFDAECWWHVECSRQCWRSQDAAAMGNTSRRSEVKINEERQPRVKLALADLSVKPTPSYSAENVTAVRLSIRDNVVLSKFLIPP